MNDREIICDGSIFYNGLEIPHVILPMYTDNHKRLVSCLQSQNKSIVLSSRGILPNDLGMKRPLYEIVLCPGFIPTGQVEYVVTSSTRYVSDTSYSMYVKNNRKITVKGNDKEIELLVYTNDNNSVWTNQDILLMGAEEYSSLESGIKEAVKQFAREESKYIYLIQEYTGCDDCIEVGYLYTREV